MKPIRFDGANATFAEDQPQYLPLPAHRALDGVVTSCWQLSLRERIFLLFTGRLWFQLWTFNDPLQPQRPSVERPPEIQSKVEDWHAQGPRHQAEARKA
jgi:hypothetical protein